MLEAIFSSIAKCEIDTHIRKVSWRKFYASLAVAPSHKLIVV
jgi:hypothetical protein